MQKKISCWRRIACCWRTRRSYGRSRHIVTASIVSTIARSSIPMSFRMLLLESPWSSLQRQNLSFPDALRLKQSPRHFHRRLRWRSPGMIHGILLEKIEAEIREQSLNLQGAPLKTMSRRQRKHSGLKALEEEDLALWSVLQEHTPLMPRGWKLCWTFSRGLWQEEALDRLLDHGRRRYWVLRGAKHVRARFGPTKKANEIIYNKT